MAIILPVQTKEVQKSLKETTGFKKWLLTPFSSLATLPDSAKKDIESLYKDQRPDKGQIAIPGWDDIVKLGPEVPVSTEKKKKMSEWRKRAAALGFKRLGYDREKIAAAERVVGPIPLSSEEFATSQKRYDRMMKIAKSPTPRTVSNVGEIMNWMDDVNDAMVTLAYLTRVGLKLMKKAAPKLALRGLPTLGTIMLAKDLFDAMKWLKAAGFLGTRRKREALKMFRSLPGLTRTKLGKLTKLGKYLPTFAESIQIAQTTELLTGYGLSLGGIVGFGLDAVSKAATTSPLKAFDKLLHADIYNTELMRKKIGGKKSPILTPASVDAMRILNLAPQLMVHSPSLSFDDNLMILTAMNHAAAFLRGTGYLNDYEVWSQPSLDVPADPPIISDGVRGDRVEAEVPDPGRAG
ncbi:MAG: hypothetical protein AAB587_01950, partial [Patescibacteria group bacterium]